MTDSPAYLDEPIHDSSGGRKLIRQIRFVCGMAVAAAIFWHFGLWAAKPLDPHGPITLLVVDQGVVGMAELLGLAVIASGLATAICGGGASDRGPLAIAVGLATLNLRGTEMDSLLLYRMTTLRAGQTAADIFPTWGLIAETWLWLALIAVGFVVGRWVDSWFAQEGNPAALKNLLRPSDFRQALGTMALGSIVAWCVVSFTLGNERYSLQKGQIYFSVAVAFMFGALVAHWFFQRTSKVWLMLTVAVVATAAYVFGSPSVAALESAQKAGIYINLRSIVRPLPIEFAAMGAIGALLEQDAMNVLRAMFGIQPDEEPA